MKRPNGIVLAVLIMALIVLAIAPKLAHAFGALEIASVVIAGVGAVPLVFKAVANFFKEVTKDKTAKLSESNKNDNDSVQNENPKEPITVSPEQIFSN